MAENIIPLIPVMLVGVVGIAYIFPGLFLKQKNLFGYISIATVSIALIISILTFNTDIIYTDFPYMGSIAVNPFSQFFVVIFLTVTLFVCLSSLHSIRNNEDEYYFLILISAFGMMVVAISEDLIALFIGFEIASLATYALAGFEKRSVFSVEGALKYFVFGGFSSALFLFGISIIYGYAQSLSISAISEVLNSPGDIYSAIGLGMVVAGLGFKVALVPFHMWAPDTYHGSHSVVSAFLAAGSKKMGFAAMFKVLILMVLAMKLEMYVLFAILSVLTMTLGNLAALVQDSVKRMLAYSSIAHAGYISMAFAVIAASPNLNLAIAGGVLHALSHAIATAGAFIVVAALGGIIIEERDLFSGLGKKYPVMALLMSIILLSLAGIPPTFGFYSKFVLFLSAIEANLLWLALAGLLNSALSLYYYSKVIMKMYWGHADDAVFIKEKSYLVAILISVILLILLGILPSPVTEWAIEASKMLLK